MCCTVYLISPRVRLSLGVLSDLSSSDLASNARFQPLPEAGARNERRLEAVGCKPLLGKGHPIRPRKGLLLMYSFTLSSCAFPVRLRG